MREDTVVLIHIHAHLVYAGQIKSVKHRNEDCACCCDPQNHS